MKLKKWVKNIQTADGARTVSLCKMTTKVTLLLAFIIKIACIFKVVFLIDLD
jgi:hypothetical protein